MSIGWLPLILARQEIKPVTSVHALTWGRTHNLSGVEDRAPTSQPSLPARALIMFLKVPTALDDSWGNKACCSDGE